MEHQVVSRSDWLDARKALLAREKEFTRLRDEINAERLALPWVKVDKDYVFDTPVGKKTLADLFDGRSQLVVYHFMLPPEWDAGCPGCSFLADHLDGTLPHLNHHDVTLIAVSRAPLDKIAAYKTRMGWTFPWASSFGGDFNPDFSVGFTEEQQRAGGIEYNYRREPPMEPGPEKPNDGAAQFAAMSGTDKATYIRERPGVSAFALEDGVVHHTYSAFARGLDALWGMYQWLDRAPKGRNEEGLWFRRHDEYKG